jgi:chemotaxis protein methyltransferase CheR
MTATMDLGPFKILVKEKCGLCFEEEKTAKLSDGIAARMRERGIAADSEYLACLQRDSCELQRLINLLTVNETYFFREPEHLDILANKLFREMLASKAPGEPVRILNAGCSTGEEPYSIIMKLLERYGRGIKGLVSIIGADIDSDALHRAELGMYTGLSFRGFPDALREKYFESAGNNRHKIKDFVKENVRFRQFNLMNETFPCDLKGMDVIFYRNVSIYFEPATQMSIFGKIAGLLNDGGWLFVSSTETLSHNCGLLSLVERDGLFCYRKNSELSTGDGRATRIVKRPSSMLPASAPPDRDVHAAQKYPARALELPAYDKPRTHRSLFEDALAHAKNKEYEKSLDCIDALLAGDASFIKAYMLKAGVFINLKRFEEAEQACMKSIARDQWCLEGHLLLGLIAKFRSDYETAARKFKEAIYTQSSCWLAHYHLADIHCAAGDRKSARREYEIVVKLLEKGDLNEHGLTFFPLAFPSDQIMHLCRHNLIKLENGKE